MVELNPCPFCGGQPRLMEESGDERVGYANTVKIQCSGCGVSNSASGDTSKGGYADNSTTKQRAVDKWNRRTPSPASTAGGERQSIGDDSEFLRLLGDWMAGLDYFQSDEHAEVKRAWAALIAHIDTWAARSAGAPALWFKRLTGAECKPDGRCYDVVFSPMLGYEPLYSGTSSAGDAVPDILFDGKAVYDEIVREVGKAYCGSPSVVADALDAVVRLIRRGAAPAPGNTENPGQS